MAKFEFIDKYKDCGLPLPERKTKESAGYDFVAAEDTLIPPMMYLHNEIMNYVGFDNIDDPVTLDQMAAITKAADAKPTLVPTGVKAKLDPNTCLKLSIRSSCPLKYWLVMANPEGLIDADYYGNSANDGHIFFQIINLSPLPIIIKKGEVIGQGRITNYLTTEDDIASGVREGGFGSTSK